MKVLKEFKEPRSLGKHVEIAGETFDLSVHYELGGYSFLTGETSVRGYYLSLMPMVRGNGFWSTAIDFRGKKMLLKEADRFAQSTLEKLFDEYLTDLGNEEVQKLVKVVL